MGCSRGGALRPRDDICPVGARGAHARSDPAGDAGQLEAALRIFDALVADFPQSSGYQSPRANTLTRLYRHEEATKAYKQALDLAQAPRDRAMIARNMSTALRRLGLFSEAIGLLQQAAAADGGTAVASVLAMATVALEIGDTAKATQAYQSALPGLEEFYGIVTKNNPSSAGQIYGIASEVAYQLRLDRDAVQHVRTAIERGDRDSRRLWLASLLAETGQRAEAAKVLSGVNTAKVSALSLAAYYVRIGDY